MTDYPFYFKILHPYIFKKEEEILGSNKKFVHYTSAAAAMSIIQKKEVWLRQPSSMNDYMEIEHGIKCLINAYGNEGQQFKKSLDLIYPETSKKLEKLFPNFLNAIRREVYILCVSEHEEDEDDHGRLSMWRAYGKETGVAIVMNNRPFFSKEAIFRAYTVPVAYCTDHDFKFNFEKIANNIVENKDSFKSIDEESFVNIILGFFRFVILSTKHKGFCEEKEWRIIYNPNLEQSKYMIHELTCIDGLPQDIYKLSIQDIKEHDDIGLNFNDFIDKIIIGPTDYPEVLYKAFVKILKQKNVIDPEKKIIVSDIPLRR